MRRLYEYMMMEPRLSEDLPTGIVQYDVWNEPRYRFGYYGFVIYDRPLNGNEVDHYNLDGPLPCWV